MKYDLNKLNSTDFEDLVQSLAKRILGNGTISFGKGTDGGREAEFNGIAPFPSTTENWDGYWVIQAKFKTITLADESKDFSWVQTQLKNELEKYGKRKTKVRQPDNYLLFTNVILTAKPNNGGRDRASKLQEEYEKNYKIKHIRIISCDDIINYIDANRDLAIAYSPFILPGDVLYKLLELLGEKNSRVLRTKEILTRFLEYEFIEDTQAKLDHAGKLTSDKVSLEKVFIDLYATPDGQYNLERQDTKFVRSIMTKGNVIIKGNEHIHNRYVLIAGPGYGKSTLTQFLTQAYRAFFLNDTDTAKAKSEAVMDFIANFHLNKEVLPKWIRLPIRITLKEFAGWINERTSTKNKLGTSVIEYITYNINRKSSGGDLTNGEVENLLHNLPCIFVFDGLDEVPVSSNRASVITELSFFTETILRKIDADAIMVATTRPQGYSKEFDSSKYQHLYITDIEQADCIIYLERLLDKIVDDLDDKERKLKILKDALNNKEIARLMKSPLQASIMAILVKSGGNPPRNKFDLFTNYYDIIFKREKQRGISSILNERPEYVQEIHNRLGLYLQSVSERSTNPAATVSKNDFIKIVKDYLIEMDLDTDAITKTSEEILTAATDRLVFISEIQDQKFGFAIRSLQEYFAAQGYLHNVNDELIRDRLRLIYLSSYWSNTFLFAIGFIAKNKIYLTDFIESICNELNGSTDENDKKNLTSIVKIGSWLALDILNEGIFSGNPKIENKFCNLLKPLFYISKNDKHREIFKLPIKIVEKWVIKFLQDAIMLNSTTSTALNIYASLEASSYYTADIISKNWPTDNTQEIHYIKTFARSGVESDFIIDKFLDKIQSPEKNLFLELFDSENDYTFIYSACKHSMTIQKSKNILFELIFITSLAKGEDSTNTIPLLKLLGINIEDLTTNVDGWMYGGDHKLSIELADGYSYEIHKTKIENNIITTLNNFATENNIILVSTICSFLIDPTNEKFIKLDALIKSLDDKYREFVLQKLRMLNSFFSSVYANGNTSDSNWSNIFQEIEELNLETLNANSDAKLNMSKYSIFSSLLSGNQIARLDEFRTTYLDSNGLTPTIAYINYFKLVMWTFSSINKENAEILLQDKVRLKSIKVSILKYIENEVLYFRDLPPIFYFLSIDNIAEFFLKDHSRLKFNLRILDAQLNYWTDGDFNFTTTLNKIIDLVNFQIIKGHNPSYKVLLQQCIFCLSTNNKVDYDSIPISAMTKFNSKGPDEKYKAIILLLNRSLTDSDYQQFENIIGANANVFSDKKFIEVLLYVLRFSVSNNIVEKIFLFLETKINDDENRSELERQIRNYVGSQPTGADKVIKLLMDV